MPDYVTRFGSLDRYEKGGVQVIDDDPRHYAFSNMFEVAAHARPWEKVAVGKNMQYVLEVIRAEGTSEWRHALHDEFVLVMDGEVEVRLMRHDAGHGATGAGDRDGQPATALEGEPAGVLPGAPPAAGEGGSRALPGEPTGPRMGRIVARRGHMALLPARAAYQFSAGRPSVLLLQTVESPDTTFRWSEICQTL